MNKQILAVGISLLFYTLEHVFEFIDLKFLSLYFLIVVWLEVGTKKISLPIKERPNE